jgi:dimethylargininase
LLIAITREVSPNIDQCELTHKQRETIDVDIAREQHNQYVECLSDLGCRILCLPAEPLLPDSVFVEDTCIALDELAIITRPGAESRRPETSSVAKALEVYRDLAFIEPPGTIDGGDVVRISKTLFVGLSSRSNRAGIDQMRNLLDPFGYKVKGVPVTDCLHLKSAVTQIATDTLLINRSRVDADDLERMKLIEVDPTEPSGANALLVGEIVVYPLGFNRTRKRIEEAGIEVKAIEISELRKAESGITCCSILLEE